MGFRKKSIIIILIIACVVFSSGCIGNSEKSEENSEPEDLFEEAELIEPTSFEYVPSDYPLHQEGYHGIIETEGGNKTYFVTESAYTDLESYFKEYGELAPFYASAFQIQVLLNPKANVIVVIYDREGNMHIGY